jgi:glycerophosphoryl diester phosphodiesterase
MRHLPLLLGHRGARAFRSVSENTFASFDLALEHGCDGFEFDVRLSGCGRAVVCHNPRVGTITVSRATATQLRELPLLEQVLSRYCDRVFLDVELKVPGLESKLLAALQSHAPQRGFVISSFLPSVILELRARSGRLPLGIICEKRSQLATSMQLPVDYIIAAEKLVTSELIEEIHAAGRKIIVWTVNLPARMLDLAAAKVEGIVSDNTRLLVETVRPQPKAAAGLKD